MLRQHPDREFAQIIVDGISQGFRIGFDRRFSRSLRSCSRNMGSAYVHPEVVSSYLVRAVTGANRDEPHRRNRPGQQFRCHSQAPPTQQMATHRRPLEPPGPKRQRRDQSRALHLLLRIGGRDCFSRPLSRPGSAAGEVRRQARV